ncbi:MAG: nucleotidyltransferase family protein [Bacteroidota bacterium]|nr:nucleotidyltransferase family protein [Bacteroidota bacterium]MDP3147461.1 nucleotidyltransferase family protein [Bacteroidota bacterium]MDP3557953.1 nucleotidyltransferase family protein [Bacteroidota bacterium]
MITTAIILAGGFGTRLQSVISELPKPMAPINNEPFLNYQLNYLKHYGIKNVILSVGYLSEKIKEYYGSNFNGLEIDYVVEETPLGTGGGIRLALEKCKDDSVLVLNGDSFFDVDLIKFFNLHKSKNSINSLALRRVDNANRYGTIEINHENKIISFQEKSNSSKEGIINGGVYILNKKLYLQSTPVNTNFSIEKDFFEKQLTNLIITGFEFDGYFIDIGIPEDYTKAQNDFKGFKYK